MSNYNQTPQYYIGPTGVDINYLRYERANKNLINALNKILVGRNGDEFLSKIIVTNISINCKTNSVTIINLNTIPTTRSPYGAGKIDTIKMIPLKTYESD